MHAREPQAQPASVSAMSHLDFIFGAGVCPNVTAPGCYCATIFTCPLGERCGVVWFRPLKLIVLSQVRIAHLLACRRGVLLVATARHRTKQRLRAPDRALQVLMFATLCFLPVVVAGCYCPAGKERTLVVRSSRRCTGTSSPYQFPCTGNSTSPPSSQSSAACVCKPGYISSSGLPPCSGLAV